MQYSKTLDKRAFLFIRSAAIVILSATFLLIGFLQVQAAEIVVDADCDLVEAITSANADGAEPGCETGSGPDTVVLSGTVISLSTADNAFGGFGNNGLPVISSTVTISGNGVTIERDLSLGCTAPPDDDDEFRFFLVNSDGNLALDNVTLQNGCAFSGGAVLATQGLTQTSVLTITQSSVLSNTAFSAGGGVYFHQGVVEGSLFRGNSVDGEGGALLLGGTGDKYLLNNRIFENSAGESGSAMYLSSAVARLENNVIGGNLPSPTEGSADIALGAQIIPSFLIAQHNTMVAGPGDPTVAIVSGLDNTNPLLPDRVLVTDTIISGYDVGLIAQNSTIIADGVLWDGTTERSEAFGEAGVVTITNDITGTAAFVDPVASDYHLTAASKAINAAVSDQPPTDFDGDIRPVGGISDLGFDEFVPNVTISVNKTVGTDADSCASTENLTVPVSSTVYYCFTLQNTGDITLTNHTFSDPILGVQTSLSFDLAPLETVQVTRSQISALGPVTITAAVTNTVFVTSTTLDEARVAQFGGTASDSDVAIVQTETPTALPEVKQPEQIGDNRVYLPSLDN